MKEDLNNIAMSIILNAGDARQLINEGLDFAENGNIESSKNSFLKADEKLVEAHRSQTKMMSLDFEEEVELNVLFVHAMDTLMTIKMLYDISLRLTKIILKEEK
ncbi:PTS lactose/cellobiose transporter subunit IIA [Breznakia pachnodae]|uniref:Cellobiose-specific phosphotransferase system component IIA n=1 Tax=Breznakia pachnodae TaxID=265178 RepID=A0ABU0E845_9FIRM|nr:PTS lactose/cellobiose transporter subunit IIA [Breznakia pachnodae]MDQ0363078.1 cellobiose-specific phosphotransferase system component IIA [Breznakia pachnodae]